MLSTENQSEPSSALSTSRLVTHATLEEGLCGWFQSTDVGTEAQRSQGTCPWSPRQCVAEPGLESSVCVPAWVLSCLGAVHTHRSGKLPRELPVRGGPGRRPRGRAGGAPLKEGEDHLAKG